MESRTKKCRELTLKPIDMVYSKGCSIPRGLFTNTVVSLLATLPTPPRRSSARSSRGPLQSFPSRVLGSRRQTTPPGRPARGHAPRPEACPPRVKGEDDPTGHCCSDQALRGAARGGGHCRHRRAHGPGCRRAQNSGGHGRSIRAAGEIEV